LRVNGRGFLSKKIFESKKRRILNYTPFFCFTSGIITLSMWNQCGTLPFGKKIHLITTSKLPHILSQKIKYSALIPH
jgi:hypothetical protein